MTFSSQDGKQRTHFGTQQTMQTQDAEKQKTNFCIGPVTELVQSDSVKSNQPGAQTYVGKWQGQEVLVKIIPFADIPAIQADLKRQFGIMNAKPR